MKNEYLVTTIHALGETCFSHHPLIPSTIKVPWSNPQGLILQQKDRERRRGCCGSVWITNSFASPKSKHNSMGAFSLCLFFKMFSYYKDLLLLPLTRGGWGKQQPYSRIFYHFIFPDEKRLIVFCSLADFPAACCCCFFSFITEHCHLIWLFLRDTWLSFQLLFGGRRRSPSF